MLVLLLLTKPILTSIKSHMNVKVMLVEVATGVELIWSVKKNSRQFFAFITLVTMATNLHKHSFDYAINEG